MKLQYVWWFSKKKNEFCLARLNLSGAQCAAPHLGGRSGPGATPWCTARHHPRSTLPTLWTSITNLPNLSVLIWTDLTIKIDRFLVNFHENHWIFIENLCLSRKLIENLSILMVKSVQIRIDRLGKFLMEVHTNSSLAVPRPALHV